ECSLIPKNPMVLAINILPCAASGKCLLDTNSSPEVGLTKWSFSIRFSGKGELTPYLGKMVPGIIQVAAGPEVCSKNGCPQSSKAMPQGFGMGNWAVRSK